MTRPREYHAMFDIPTIIRCAPIWNHERSLLDVLQAEYGHLRCEDIGGSYGWGIRYSQLKRFRALGITTLGEYIDRFTAGHETLPYLMHLSVFRNLPRLRRYFVLPPAFGPNWANCRWLDRLSGPELFLGQKGTGFGPLHQDHASVHIGFYQFSGHKRFLCYPPSDAPYLYRTRGAQFPFQLRNSNISGFDDAPEEKFPLLANASPTELTLRAGEALWVPANWWHTTVNLLDTVSYSIRIVNHTNALRLLGVYSLGLPRAARVALGY